LFPFSLSFIYTNRNPLNFILLPGSIGAEAPVQVRTKPGFQNGPFGQFDSKIILVETLKPSRFPKKKPIDGWPPFGFVSDTNQSFDLVDHIKRLPNKYESIKLFSKPPRVLGTYHYVPTKNTSRKYAKNHYRPFFDPEFFYTPYFPFDFGNSKSSTIRPILYERKPTNEPRVIAYIKRIPYAFFPNSEWGWPDVPYIKKKPDFETEEPVIHHGKPFHNSEIGGWPDVPYIKEKPDF